MEISKIFFLLKVFKGRQLTYVYIYMFLRYILSRMFSRLNKFYFDM